MSARQAPAHELRPMLPQPALVPMAANAPAPAYTPALHDAQTAPPVLEEVKKIPKSTTALKSLHEYMDL